MGNYETVIGCEIHVELSTKSKIFCSCGAQFGADANTQCCPVCTGMPGSLPVLNRSVVEFAAKAGLATGCAVQNFSRMDRKNYFYPDLPKAYQISQLDYPICLGGHLDIPGKNGETRRIGITRIHIEEDAGKLLHDPDGDSVVDMNRCGRPLIEIVTKPDMRSAHEARAFLEELRAILVCIGVSDCKMEEASMRCDVNLSLRPVGSAELGTRTETKNLNSLRAVVNAIEYEVSRQTAILDGGGAVDQQTRRFDDKTGSSVTMRSKEDAQDYRYFPDPDLVAIRLTDSVIDNLRAALPELPALRKQRYMRDYGLTKADVDTLFLSPELAEYYASVLAADGSVQPRAVFNWVMGDLSHQLNESSTDLSTIRIAPADFARLVALHAGGLSSSIAKQVFAAMFETGKVPDAIMDERGLRQLDDADALREIALRVIAENPGPVADYKAGVEKALTALMGRVMKETKGKANPQIAGALLRELLR